MLDKGTSTHLQLHGRRMLHDCVARVLRPGLRHGCGSRPGLGRLPRLRSWPGHGMAQVRALPVCAWLTPLGSLLPRLHVRGHGRPGQSGQRRRLRGSCFHTKHSISMSTGHKHMMYQCTSYVVDKCMCADNQEPRVCLQKFRVKVCLHRRPTTWGSGWACLLASRCPHLQLLLLLRLQLLQLLDLLQSQRRRGVLLVRGPLLPTCRSSHICM